MNGKLLKKTLHIYINQETNVVQSATIILLLSTYFLKIQQHAANCDCSCRQLILIVYVDN